MFYAEDTCSVRQLNNIKNKLAYLTKNHYYGISLIITNKSIYEEEIEKIFPYAEVSYNHHLLCRISYIDLIKNKIKFLMTRKVDKEQSDDISNFYPNLFITTFAKEDTYKITSLNIFIYNIELLINYINKETSTYTNSNQWGTSDMTIEYDAKYIETNTSNIIQNSAWKLNEEDADFNIIFPLIL